MKYTQKIVIDESVRPSITDEEIVVHSGASLMGRRVSEIVIRYLKSPLTAYDLDWLNELQCRIVPKHLRGENQ